MEINLLTLRNSLNKAYLKVKPNRTQIETFKKNITNLFDQIKESESEEFHKNIISGFLKNTYYSPDHYINTKGRSDLVIHNGKDSHSTVGVLFETKKPGNKPEMPACENINTKAFHELILYYLRERISNKNIEVKLGLLASKFLSFLYIRLSSIALKDDFRQTTLGELRKLPIPILDDIKHKPMIELLTKYFLLNNPIRWLMQVTLKPKLTGWFMSCMV